MLRTVFNLVFLSLSVSGSSLPRWVDLNCERGHKYLFSDVQHTWQDARDECELYEGYLLSINSLQEQNCLVRYAQGSVQHGWFWHDATDNETESVYVHALDSSDLTWLPHLWRVSDRVEFTNTDGDYTVLGLHGGTGYLTGNWGSVTEDRTFYFICEGFIE